MPYLDRRVISVTEFNKIINLLVSDIEPFWIEGEVIGFKNWQDKIVFFDIKDASSVLHCSLYFSRLQTIGFNLEDGMKIRITGEPQLRSNRGEFNLNVRDVQLSGEGSFKKAYELLKKKLKVEGFFDRKRELPAFINTIGVITSKDGAVIHDFKKNLKQINYKIFFYSTLVEGERSAPSITKAIKWFNQEMSNLDVLVIMRGGGSLESLQGFNNETLVRTIYSSKIPTICGIGHEIDVPLASLVSDISVSTPTAAANHINESWNSLQENIPYWEERMFNEFNSLLNQKIRKTSELSQRMISNFNQVFNLFNNMVSNFNNLINILNQQIEITYKKIERGKEKIVFLMEKTIEKKIALLVSQEKYLEVLSPEKNLKLGYAIMFDQQKKVIKDINKVEKGDLVTTKLYKGSFVSKINKINK